MKLYVSVQARNEEYDYAAIAAARRRRGADEL